MARSSLIDIIADRADLVSTRELGGQYDLQEHTYRDRESGRTYTIQSQLCLVCSGTGNVRLEAVERDGTQQWAVYPGVGGVCELCGGVGRMPTKRTVRKGLESAQRRAINAKQQIDIINAELAQLLAGLPVQGWVVPPEDIPADLAEKHGATPGDALVALPHDDAAVATARRLGGYSALLYQDGYPHMVAYLEKARAEEEDEWVAATESAEWFEWQLNAITMVVSGYQETVRLRATAAAREAAEAAAAQPVRHDPAKVCNGYEVVKGKRKRCHRSPTEWDTRGHGWCKRHARKRGLNVRPEEGEGGNGNG